MGRQDKVVPSVDQQVQLHVVDDVAAGSLSEHTFVEAGSVVPIVEFVVVVVAAPGQMKGKIDDTARLGFEPREVWDWNRSFLKPASRPLSTRRNSPGHTQGQGPLSTGRLRG